MKTAIYIEDGVLQLVITPETEHEKGAIKLFEDKKIDAQIFTGSFYDCRGGWVRQSHHSRSMSPFSLANTDDQSLILRINKDEKDSQAEATTDSL